MEPRTPARASCSIGHPCTTGSPGTRGCSALAEPASNEPATAGQRGARFWGESLTTVRVGELIFLNRALRLSA